MSLNGNWEDWTILKEFSEINRQNYMKGLIAMMFSSYHLVGDDSMPSCALCLLHILIHLLISTN